MLHNNRTPFGAYHRVDGHIGVAVAASNKDIHKKAMVFERVKVRIAERQRVLLQVSPEAAAGRPPTAALPEEAIGRALLGTWMQPRPPATP